MVSSLLNMPVADHFRARFTLAMCVACLFMGPPTVHGGTPSTQPAATHRPTPPIEGMWVWKAQYVSDTAEQDKMLDFCSRHGFNRLLVQVPWKPGTAQVVHPTTAEAVQPGTAIHPKMRFPKAFARLITEAAKRQIVVEALDGAPHMGDKIRWPETLATVDAIIEFNAALPAGAKLAGVHWDIEPYVRPDWKDQASRVTIETDYLGLLSAARAKLQPANLTLAVDIPMWYDHKTDPGDSCIVTFDGQTKNFHEYIQDLTDYVGIMSYRQHALGKNSTMEHVETELAYAEKIGKFVVPAFETIQLKDTPQITFYGLSAERFLTEKRTLEDALKDRPGFGGMFVHHYDSVRALLEPEASAAK